MNKTTTGQMGHIMNGIKQIAKAKKPTADGFYRAMEKYEQLLTMPKFTNDKAKKDAVDGVIYSAWGKMDIPYAIFKEKIIIKDIRRSYQGKGALEDVNGSVVDNAVVASQKRLSGMIESFKDICTRFEIADFLGMINKHNERIDERRGHGGC